MKTIHYLMVIGLVLAAMVFQGCAYSHIQGPLDTNFILSKGNRLCVFT